MSERERYRVFLSKITNEDLSNLNCRRFYMMLDQSETVSQSDTLSPPHSAADPWSTPVM